MAGSMAYLLRKPVQVVDRVRSGYQQCRLQTGEIPGLRRGVQGERVLGSGDGQVGDELGTRQDQGCVNLVRDDSHSEGPGQSSDRDEFAPGVHGSGGVVGVGQQQHGPCRDALGRGEGHPERLHVESAVGSERRFDHSPVGVGDEGVERRVDGRAHHHGIARRRDQPQRLDDAHHHVRDDGRLLDLEAPPVPAVRGERPEGTGVGTAAGIAGVAGGDGLVQPGRDRLGERHVHLGHPEGQYVGRKGGPLHAGPGPQLVDRQLFERVHDRRIRVGWHGRDASHDPRSGR